MDRRRSLMGVGPIENKTVNRIVLYPFFVDDSLYVHVSCTHIPTSTIQISCITSGLNGEGYISIEKGRQNKEIADVDVNVHSTKITVTSLYPQEDDMYVYEVIITY